MKNYLLILCLFFAVFSAKAQVNLVPNPSFEQFDTCPEFSGLTRYATGWTMNVNSADYFNSCGVNQLPVSTPTNAWGSQYPHHGNGYFGFYSFGQLNPSAKEFFGRSLSSALVVGQTYFVTFYVSLADGNPPSPNIMCGTNNIGMKFFTYSFPSPLISNNLPFVNNFSQINLDDVITDTLSWTKISGSFIADSAYTHFLIGRFYDNANSNFMCLDSSNINNRWSYYFVDNICISTDSNTCNLVTKKLEIINENTAKIFPNPAGGKTNIENVPFGNYVLRIYSLYGTIIYERFIEVNNKQYEITIPDNFNGMFYIEIQNSFYKFNQKLILTKN